MGFHTIVGRRGWLLFHAMLSKRQTLSGFICPQCDKFFDRKREGLAHFHECTASTDRNAQQLPALPQQDHRTASADTDTSTLHVDTLAATFCSLMDVHCVPHTAVQKVQDLLCKCVSSALEHVQKHSTVSADVINMARENAIPEQFRNTRRTKAYLEKVSTKLVG